ncbi:MAG: KH domain-containing protein [Deltaproteobacteria bacterium]|jgi:predicted RNA-binding protein YlqC (UPF0109 family)|nr:KH domain-containing protein [Deltaproteobacteria bacterium]
MLELVRYLASNLGNHPEEVEVTESENSQGQKVICLKVHSSDLCAVIGKNGRTIRAIRTLMSVAGAKTGQCCLLKVDTDLERI